TYHLLEGIRGAGDRDRDGKVEVTELFKYVSAAVSRDARTKYDREQTPWMSTTHTADVYLSRAQPRDAGPATSSSLKRLWREKGPLAVLQQFEENPQALTENRLAAVLRFLGSKGDPAAVPFLFRFLAHPSPAVHQQALKAVLAIGWEKAA